MSLFRQERHDDKVKRLVESFPWMDREESEPQFKNRLRDHIYAGADVSVKTEGGVQGFGTRVDIYIQCPKVDVIISIKKDLDEQKAKIILGEALILANSWRPGPLAERVHFLVVPFGKMGSAEAAILEPLGIGLTSLSRVNPLFTADFAIPGVALAEVSERPFEAKSGRR